ncbi:MAG: amidohydrolase family protein [Acidobacteriota bacterium]
MKFHLIAASLFLVAMVSGVAAHEANPSTARADAVFVDGQFYTANPRQPWATAVAIKGDRILYVGDETGVSDFVDSETQQYPLNGKLVLPGLIDTHTHPGFVAQSVGGLWLDDAATKEELLQAIAEMVENNPDRPVLRGGYWRNEIFDQRGPHKRDLDRIESSRPVILSDSWGHSVWANSRALELAGVDRNTPDIIPGLAFYQRDENGEPTGWITESAAIVFTRHFQTISKATEQSILRYLHYLRDLGVTTILDAGNFGWDDEIYTVISRWDKEGVLPLRYHGTYTLFLPDDLSGAVAELKRMRRAYGSDRVRIETLKVFLDGVIETRTADMSESYLDTPGNSGHSLLNQAQLRQLILDLHAEDLDMHVHTVGNKAIHSTLNAVEEAKKSLSEPLKTQVTLCHLEVMNDSDFNRFKDLGVIASFTPHWHGGDAAAVLELAVGDKARSMMRAQPLISDGAVVTFSSDITDETEWKSDRANPYLGMQVGHNKQDIEGGAAAVLAPPRSERLSLDSLVDGYTRNAAFQLGRLDELGSIEVGKKADLVVLNRNLFEVDRYDIHKIRPAAVFMDGKLVHGELPRK